MSAPVPQPASETATITSGGQFLLLLVRSVFGYGVLFACILLLLKRPAWSLSAIDWVYWLTLVLVLFLHRQAMASSDGLRAWPKFAIGHVVVAGALWTLAQSVQAIT